MKATEQYFPVVLFIILLKAVLKWELFIFRIFRDAAYFSVQAKAIHIKPFFTVLLKFYLGNFSFTISITLLEV